MVLCRFYLLGTCRFGSKCHNEHVDVKQIVKTDMESALNGKQWPLSGYGPFKDTQCIPNFIEDQSFEEIRLLCYESKQKNCFDEFDRQFKKEVYEASQKMKLLLQFPPNVIDVICNIYNKTAETNTTVTGGTVAANANPFSTLGSGNSNVGSSLFSKPAGNSSNSSIFGAGSSNAFGGAVNSNTMNSNSLFGASSNVAPTNSIFGNSGNVFGNQAMQTGATATSSIFGQTAATPMGGTSFFGAPVNSSALNNGNNNIFAQTASNNQNATNTFGAPSAQTSIFATANQQPQQQTTNIFGQASNPFATQTQQLQQQQQQHMTPSNNSGLFAVAANASGLPAATNVFGQVTPASNNIFAQQTQQPQQTANSNLFAMAMQQITDTSSPTSVLSVYSRMEDLTAEEIEAYKAETFLKGKIPFNPPPKELIN